MRASAGNSKRYRAVLMRMFLEETGLPYRKTPADTGKGKQFTPQFLAISPNNSMAGTWTTSRM